MVALADTVALVTGAAGGIGLAIARDLAARGVRVTVADNDAAAGQAAATQLPRARFQAADLADAPACRACPGDGDIMLTAPFLLTRAALHALEAGSAPARTAAPVPGETFLRHAVDERREPDDEFSRSADR